MFRQRGGYGHRCGNSSFVPFLGILTRNFAFNCRFVIPRKGYFIKFELFFSPKGWEFNQKIVQKSNAWLIPFSMPPSPPPPYIQTSNITCIKPCQWCANYIGIDWPGWAVPIFIIFFLYIMVKFSFWDHFQMKSGYEHVEV